MNQIHKPQSMCGDGLGRPGQLLKFQQSRNCRSSGELRPYTMCFNSFGRFSSHRNQARSLGEGTVIHVMVYREDSRLACCTSTLYMTLHPYIYIYILSAIADEALKSRSIERFFTLTGSFNLVTSGS